MPSFNGLAAQENSNGSCIRSTYDQNTKIDTKVACDFVTYWANLAFDYETTDTFANQQAASRWTSDAIFNRRLEQTLWTKDFRTRPSQCQLISVGNPHIMDDKTCAVDMNAVFSWNLLGLKAIPMRMHFIVEKQSEGYRILSVTVDHINQTYCDGFLYIGGDNVQMYYLKGEKYVEAKRYREAMKNLKAQMGDKHSFDHVFITWCQSLNVP